MWRTQTQEEAAYYDWSLDVGAALLTAGKSSNYYGKACVEIADAKFSGIFGDHAGTGRTPRAFTLNRNWGSRVAAAAV